MLILAIKITNKGVCAYSIAANLLSIAKYIFTNQ